MAQQFAASYFYTSNGFGANEVREATLTDLDLLRGNTSGEQVTRTGTTGEIFDGFPVIRAGTPNFFEQVSGEVATTVTFKDGTSLGGVLGLLEQAAGPFGEFTNQFLFDQRALAAVGKTVADIENAQVQAFVDHDLSWADLGFVPAAVTTPTIATATYFSQSNITTGTGFGIGTLIDNDLLRDRDFGESVDLGFGQRPGGGSLRGFGSIDDPFGRGEVVADITFTDGTTLSGVNALFEAILIAGVGGADQFFLFDTAALAAVGKTVTDVARVTSFTSTDHNLNWTDFGFSGTPITPAPPAPPKPPPPVLNIITGTAGADVLVGTAGADLIRGGDGNDRLIGRAGEDTFVFGADARDSNRDRDRDRDVITDFNAAEDTILFEAGATVRLVEARNGNLFIQLDGDRDTITVLNAGLDAQSAFEFADGIFIG